MQAFLDELCANKFAKGAAITIDEYNLVILITGYPPLNAYSRALELPLRQKRAPTHSYKTRSENDTALRSRKMNDPSDA